MALKIVTDMVERIGKLYDVEKVAKKGRVSPTGCLVERAGPSSHPSVAQEYPIPSIARPQEKSIRARQSYGTPLSYGD